MVFSAITTPSISQPSIHSEAGPPVQILSLASQRRSSVVLRPASDLSHCRLTRRGWAPSRSPRGGRALQRSSQVALDLGPGEEAPQPHPDLSQFQDRFRDAADAEDLTKDRL